MNEHRLLNWVEIAICVWNVRSITVPLVLMCSRGVLDTVQYCILECVQLCGGST